MFQGRRNVWMAAITIVAALILVPPGASAQDLAGSGNVTLPPLEPQKNSIYYIPQLGNGYLLGGLSITSRISISSVAGTDGVATVSFLQDDGTPWNVPVVCRQNGTIGGQMSSVPLVVPAGKSLTLETLGVGPLAVGWAKVEANCPLLVSASYTVFMFEAVPATALLGATPTELGPPPQAWSRPLWEAGVPSAPCGTKLSLNPVVGPEVVMFGVFNDAGLAIANPSDQAAHVTVTIFSHAGGAALGQKTVNLTPLGHFAGYITELFPAVAFTQHTQLEVRLSSNVAITAAALQRLNGNGADVNGSLTVTPDSSLARTIVYDTEDNDDRAHAQPLIPTAEVIGVQNDTDDTAENDYFSVYVAANRTLYVTLLTESIGSSIDPELRIINSSGTSVASGSPLSSGLLDSFVKYKSAVNATYYIKIATFNNTYGRDSFYRMFVRLE